MIHRETNLFFSLLILALLLTSCGPLSSNSKVPAGGNRAYTVKMMFDHGKMIYSPAKLNIQLGDSVTFLMVSGAPHTVTFETDGVPGASSKDKKKLADQLTYKKKGGFFTTAGEKYTINFNHQPIGIYRYYCIPHRGMGMKGKIRVRG